MKLFFILYFCVNIFMQVEDGEEGDEAYLETYDSEDDSEIESEDDSEIESEFESNNMYSTT